MTSIFKKAIISLIMLVLVINSSSIKSFANINYNQEEMSGVWLSTVYNLDWPSSKDYNNIENQKRALIENFEFIKNQNMNTVFFQVRGMGDALFPSSHAPWSKYLTGTLGKNPGYDTLQFALTEAKKQGLEFHAWINPFRIDTNSSTFDKTKYINALPDSGKLKSNPDWIVKYDKYHWLNIGIPEAREYVIELALEIVSKYDIDGIHIDDYFYPYPVKGVDFPDDEAYEKHGHGYSSKADWRRDNVNKFIKELSQRIKDVKPYVKFGVSPFGIWKNGTSVGGSNTNGLSSYDSLYVDSKKWIEEEWIDYIVPQVYWEFENKSAPYATLVDWWNRIVENKKVDLYIGNAVYKVGDSTKGEGWLNPDQLVNQVKYSREKNNIKGNCFFSLSDLKSNKLNILESLKEVYITSVKPPQLQWYKEEDFNKDGIVDILDLAIISQLYNVQERDITWNVNLDLSKDKIIDIYDLVKVSKLIGN